MSIYYRMESQNDNLNPEGKKKQGLYPKIVKKQTVGLKELAQRIAEETTFNKHEVESAIGMAFDNIIKELCNGNHVNINGFGSFSLSAESKKVVQQDDEIRAESVLVKRVLFRTSRTLMKNIRHAKFERLPW